MMMFLLYVFLQSVPPTISTGELPTVSVTHYILCHGTGLYISYIPPIGLTPFGPGVPHVCMSICKVAATYMLFYDYCVVQSS